MKLILLRVLKNICAKYIALCVLERLFILKPINKINLFLFCPLVSLRRTKSGHVFHPSSPDASHILCTAKATFYSAQCRRCGLIYRSSQLALGNANFPPVWISKKNDLSKKNDTPPGTSFSASSE